MRVFKPGDPDHLVTTVKLEHGPGHDYVRVWNRGGHSGTLTVTKGDGEDFVDLLFDFDHTEVDEGGFHDHE